MVIRAILSDFDGTLVPREGQYDKRLPSIIKKIQAKNIHFSIATGRASYSYVGKVIQELGLNDFHIFHGGGLILNYITGDIFWHRPISEESVQKIYSYFAKKKLVFMLETKDYAYISQRIELRTYPKEFLRILTHNEVPTGIVKILFHSGMNKMSETTVETHIEKILESCKDVEITKFVHGGYFGLDITSEASTKHTAALEYAKLLKINPKEMVAIGDGYNDYPLFTACGYKIAMENAPKELKDIADKIVNTVENGGMVEALEHILKF